MAQVTGGGGGGGAFEVDVVVLGDGAGWLRTDGGDVESAGATASGGSSAGSGCCGGGLLAGALARFAAALDDRSGSASTAVAGAGDTLASNAVTYTGADASAAHHLDATFTGPIPDFALGSGSGSGSGLGMGGGAR